MAKGKQTCKILKEIRKQIATENDIEFVTSECTYKGDCKGTCPKCESEVRYLERELEKRQRLGKAAVVAGLSVGLLGASQVAVAQQPDTVRMDTIEKTAEDVEIFGMVEDMPSFPGGEAKLMEYIAKNVNYPKEAIEKGIEGRVFVGFVVDVDGSVVDVEVKRGIGGGCDEEAVRVVKSMPKWKPGKIQGVVQKFSYMIPVAFKLEDQADHEEENKTTLLSDERLFEAEYISPSPKDYKIENPEDEIYQIVEEMPEFPGGIDKQNEFVANNTHYPEEAKKAEIQGRVYVGFVVEKDGSLTNVKVLRGIGYGCDEEAMRVVRSMPNWEPGMQRGKAVRVSYLIPVNFKLEDTKE